MGIADIGRPIMEDLRVFFADEGFRRYDILMRIIDYPNSNTPCAEDEHTITDTNLTIQGRRIGVGLVTTKDIVASNGLLTDIDYRIGPITPSYSDPLATFPTGGMDISQFNPDVVDYPREIYFRLTGPAMEDGQWFKKIGQEIFRNWSYIFFVRKEGSNPPEPT